MPCIIVMQMMQLFNVALHLSHRLLRTKLMFSKTRELPVYCNKRLQSSDTVPLRSEVCSVKTSLITVPCM